VSPDPSLKQWIAAVNGSCCLGKGLVCWLLRVLQIMVAQIKLGSMIGRFEKMGYGSGFGIH
jgi:hypothetical protein